VCFPSKIVTAIKRPTCSAIILNYNHSAYLPSVLNVVLDQTVPFDEIIIVDDASTDNSVELINDRIHDIPQARLVKNPKNLGVVLTLNVGLKEAKGDFVFYISADDNYSPHIVEWCRLVLERYPNSAMISGNVRICNSVTGTERAFFLSFPQETGYYSRQDLSAAAKKRVITFYGGANLIRRDAMIEAGGHLESLKWHADWFVYLLIAYRHPFAVIPHEFTRIRQSSGQYSHACYDWKTQKPVIEAFIRTLKDRYPDEYGFFRTNALLPTYDIETFFLLLLDKTLRHYLTPLLIWRLLTYKSLRMAGRLLPDAMRPSIRRLLRV
jgi:glycosyltransferase involved in cell wall biosynthesis